MKKVINKQHAKNALRGINSLVKIRKNLTYLQSQGHLDYKDENVSFTIRQINFELDQMTRQFGDLLSKTGYSAKLQAPLTGFMELCKTRGILTYVEPKDEETQRLQDEAYDRLEALPDYLPSK